MRCVYLGAPPGPQGQLGPRKLFPPAPAPALAAPVVNANGQLSLPATAPVAPAVDPATPTNAIAAAPTDTRWGFVGDYIDHSRVPPVHAIRFARNISDQQSRDIGQLLRPRVGEDVSIFQTPPRADQIENSRPPETEVVHLVIEVPNSPRVGVSGAPAWLNVGATVDYVDGSGAFVATALIKAVHTDDPTGLYCTILLNGAEQKTPLDRLCLRGTAADTIAAPPNAALPDLYLRE